MDKDATDEIGDPSLARAVAQGDRSRVEALLSRGVSTSSERLLDAIGESRDIEVTKRLIQSGLNLDRIYGGGYSLLSSAAEDGHTAFCRELLALGADPNPDDQLNTPLHYAARSGNAELVRALLAADADPDAYDSDDTSLMLAAQNGHVEIVRALLEAGASTNEVDPPGHTALCKARSPEIVALLRKAGATPCLKRCPVP